VEMGSGKSGDQQHNGERRTRQQGLGLSHRTLRNGRRAVGSSRCAPATYTGSMAAMGRAEIKPFSQAQRGPCEEFVHPWRLAKQILEQQTNALPQQQGPGLHGSPANASAQRRARRPTWLMLTR